MEKTEDMMWVARCALLDDRKAFASLVDKYQGAGEALLSEPHRWRRIAQR